MNLSLDIINSILLVCIKPAIALAVVMFLINRINYRGAATNHWILLAGLFSPLLLVIFFLTLPAWNLHILPSSVASLSDLTVIAGSRGPMEEPNLITLVIVAVYFFGFAWAVSYLIAGVISIAVKTDASRRLDDAEVDSLVAEISQKYGVKRKVELYVDDSIHSPLVWGLTESKILLPAKFRYWSKPRLHRVLAHEMAHIARNDWLIKLLAHTVCAVFWFLPPIWMVARRLEWYAELACDDLLLTHYQCRAEYADDLLLLSSEFRNEYFALSFIKRSELYRRINAVLDGGRVRVQPNRLTRLAIFLWAIILLLPVSLAYPVVKIPGENHHDYYPIVLKNTETGSGEGKKLFRTEKVRTIPLAELRENFYLKPNPIKAEEVVVDGKFDPVIVPGRSYTELGEFEPGNDTEPDLPTVKVEGYLPLVMKTPRYPARALRNNIEGTVIVQFDINEWGRVVNPRIVLSQPGEVFDSPVLKAIKEFTFRPLRVNGKAVITENVTETFRFHIEDTTDKPKEKPRLVTTELVRKD